MVEFDNWYLRRILLNFSGDNSTYLAVKELVVNNLNSMGVEASMDDGMTTLANKILDVEPTIVVDGFDIGLTLNASSDSVFVGDTVVLSTHLTAVYDTEEVDLVGDLQNASVGFYANDTLLGTSTTNSNGIATYNYTTVDDTDLSFKAVFSGTDNFDDAESNTVNVTVSEEGGTTNVSVNHYRKVPIIGYVEANDCYFYIDGVEVRADSHGNTSIANLTYGEHTFTSLDGWVCEDSTITVDDNHTTFTLYWHEKEE